MDWHLGRGVLFRLGAAQQASQELYSHVVRVTVPHGHLPSPAASTTSPPKASSSRIRSTFFLSVSPTGEVLFQYSPGVTPADTPPGAPAAALSPSSPLPAPAVSERLGSATRPAIEATKAKEKAKSERYVGRLGDVRTHRTKQGKLVAEVELTVPIWSGRAPAGSSSSSPSARRPKPSSGSISQGRGYRGGHSPRTAATRGRRSRMDRAPVLFGPAPQAALALDAGQRSSDSVPLAPRPRAHGPRGDVQQGCPAVRGSAAKRRRSDAADPQQALRTARSAPQPILVRCSLRGHCQEQR